MPQFTDPAGLTWFVVMLDAPGDPDGGDARLALGADGLQEWAMSTVVEDDPASNNDRYAWDIATGTGSFQWAWAPCCNDGMVIGHMPRDRPWCIRPRWSGLKGVDTVGLLNPTPDGMQLIELTAEQRDNLEICGDL